MRVQVQPLRLHLAEIGSKFCCISSLDHFLDCRKTVIIIHKYLKLRKDDFSSLVVFN